MTTSRPHEISEQNSKQIDSTRRSVLNAIGASTLLPLVSSVARATANPDPETVVLFDRDQGEFPENITVDKRGNKYVSLPPRGEIRKLASRSLSQSTVASLDVGDDGVGTLGVQATPRGTIYATHVSFNSTNSDTHGVWRISRNGTLELFAALDQGTFPNDLLLRKHSLLVTDSIGGQIITVTQDDPEPWLNDPLLNGTGEFGLGFPIGANGIAAGRDGTVYVANTENGRIVQIPVAPDGSAGTPVLYVENSELIGIDGIAMDTRDNIYAAINAMNTVVRVNPEKTIETLADADDGLDAPSDVAFGTARGEQKDVFITNFAFPMFSPDPDPSLMQLDVGVPGLPIHP